MTTNNKHMPPKIKTKSFDLINTEIAKYELIIRQLKCKIKKILSHSYMDFLLDDFEYLTRLEVSLRFDIIPEKTETKLSKLNHRYRGVSLSPIDW